MSVLPSEETTWHTRHPVPAPGALAGPATTTGPVAPWSMPSTAAPYSLPLKSESSEFLTSCVPYEL